MVGQHVLLGPVVGGTRTVDTGGCERGGSEGDEWGNGDGRPRDHAGRNLLDVRHDLYSIL
jgi:hypothetical protein